MAAAVKLITTVLCIWQYSLSIDISDWQSPNSPLLPRAIDGIAICYKNDSILMFGGQPQEFNRQLIRYQISTRQFIDYGETALPKSVQSNAQYYAQINNMFYWLQFLNGDYKIIAYDLSDDSINYNNVTIDKFQTVTTTYVHTGIACLASHNDLLFVSGGYDGFSQYLSEIQIYNISSQTWITNVPQMQTQRGSHCCIFDPIHKELYQIGGTTLKPGFVYDNVYSVEKILIDDISNQNWIYIENLTYPVSGARAVMYKDAIFIIGGLYGNYTTFEQHYIDKIHIINTSTGHVSISGVLNYSVAQTAAIVVNDTIYSFGGTNNNGPLTKWQYMDGSVLSINSTETASTHIPSTMLPTTINPTTSRPTTLHPTTMNPTSSPSTEIPTTALPTTALPTTALPPTTLPTTSLPTTSLPTTSLPTTSLPTLNPTTSNPTTANPTTLTSTTNPTVLSTVLSTVALPTTASPITSNPTTIHPTTASTIFELTHISTTSNPITLSPTKSSTNSTLFYGISISISFMYDIDVNSSDSFIILQIIQKTILKISTADQQCVLFHDTSSEYSSGTTNFNITLSLCNKQTQQTLIASIQFNQDLKTDLLKNINNETNLFVSDDDISLSIDKIFANELFMNITSTLIAIENTNSNYIKKDDAWIYVLIAGGILLACLLIISLVICAYKCKKLDQLQVENTMGKHASDQQTTYGIVYNVEANKTHSSIQMNEMNDLCTTPITPGNDDHSLNPDKLSTVKVWIGTIVKLPEYYDIFIQNGYETMDIIQEIKGMSELQDIGVDDSNHQIQIMTAIQQLTKREVQPNKAEGDESTLDGTIIIQSDSEEYETRGNEGITTEKEIKRIDTAKEHTQTAQ